jgi:hypothetical protein
MKRLMAAFAGLLMLLSAACGPTRPTAGVAVGPDGATGAVGVQSGRVSAGVNTNGNGYVAADVVQTENVAVSVGTGGVGVAIGAGPVRIGFGSGGWGLRI